MKSKDTVVAETKLYSEDKRRMK